MGPMTLTFLLFATMLLHSEAFQAGAPLQTCHTRTPKHRESAPQTSPPPFAIRVSKRVVVNGNTLSVMITPTLDNIQFKGFILQALTPHSNDAIGSFTTIPDNAQYLDCAGSFQNTVTHTNKDLKKSLTFDWQAPSGYNGEVVFNGTIVQDYTTYWVGVLSDKLQVVDHSGDNSSHSVGISTTKSPKTTTSPEPYTIKPVTKVVVKKDPIYDGCSVTKSCFGVPDNCIQTGNCEAIVTCLVKGTDYEFEMMAQNIQFIAVGLSDDDKMGEDSVVECVHDDDGNKVNIYMSWNYGKKNQRLNTTTGIEARNASYVDGTVYCRFSRDVATYVKNRTYDLANNKYYLLLATGTLLLANKAGLQYHDRLFKASEQSKYLADVSGFTISTNLKQKLHSAFMVGAWIGSASLGILLARYFKQTWVGTQFCGKDLWFVWHRMFMILTWSLTIAGFILIFVDRRAWASRDGETHAIFGCITTVLAFFQPIGAAFRPHPDSRQRPLFNWLHWLVGNVAHILAIVTIFFAGKLPSAELPKWSIWILVAYVAFHVCMHLIFSIAGCISERQSGKRVNSFPMKHITNSRTALQSAERKQDAPHSCFRKFLLAIYIIGILAITAALIVIIVLAPIEKQWEKLKQRLTVESSDRTNL